MAKVGFWLQGATGKLAGSKLQNGVNGTVIANNMKKPKNPKTVNQTMQRVLLNTVSQAYSELQPICSHAFQGVTEGAKSMAQFQSLNLKYFREKAAEVGEDQLAAYVNFVPVGEKGIRPAAFIVADGKLPRVAMAINASYQAVLALTANTYQNIIDKYDLQRGDQLTFVAVVENTEYPGSYEAKYARIILDPRNADGSEADLSSAFINGSSINLPNSKNNGNFGLLTYSNGMVFNFKANEKVCSVACIVSRFVNDEWKRSFAQMVVSEAAIGENGISLARAISRSLDGSSIRLSDGNEYLNNAGVSGGQSTTSGGGSSEEQIEDEAVSFPNNEVAFTANGSSTSNNVSGGSVSVTGPLTQMQFAVSLNGTAANLKVYNGASEVGTVTMPSQGTLQWDGEVANGNTLTVKKVVDGTETTWFTVAVRSTDPDDNGGFNNE